MTRPFSRYFAYVKKSIRGPFYPADIAQIQGFTRNTLICPETALGQWREAHSENTFTSIFETASHGSPAQAPKMHQPGEVHDLAMRSLLEKAIVKNSDLETQFAGMRKDQERERKHFEEELKKKDIEIRALADKLKATAAIRQVEGGEHPSWENLYKTFKKRADEKIAEATETIAEKCAEIAKLRTQMQNMVDNYEESKQKTHETFEKQISELRRENAEYRSEAEEKEVIVRTMTDSMQSMMSKNEEIQRIMLDERRDHEAQNSKFCEEIGKLKGEVKWKHQELEQLKVELFEALTKVREFESMEHLKTRQESETYSVIHDKIRILAGYFENLETKLKYAFKKA